MRKNAKKSSEGFALVDLFMASGILSTGVLAFMSSMMGSLQVARQAREISLATDAAMSVIEEFRNSSAVDFDAALVTFADRTVVSKVKLSTGKTATVHTDVILDETLFNPPVDLNGDGFATLLTPAQANAAYLRTTVTFGNGKKPLTFLTLIARSEVLASGTPAGGPPGGGTPPGTTIPGGTSAPKVASPTNNTSPIPTPTVTFPPQLDPLVTLASKVNFSKKGDKVSFSLISRNALNVVAIHVKSSLPGFIKEVKINSVKVYNDRSGAATGTLVDTLPFTLNAGQNSVDALKFLNKVDMSNATLSMTFINEAGGYQTIQIQ